VFKSTSSPFHQRHTSHLSKLLVQLVYTFPERSTYRQGSPRHLDCKLVVWLRPHIPVTEEWDDFFKMHNSTDLYYLSFFAILQHIVKLLRSHDLFSSSLRFLQWNYYILTYVLSSFLFTAIEQTTATSSAINLHCSSMNFVNIEAINI